MQTSAVSSSLEVASWFLSRAQDEGQLLEHEKLQYLLFLSQFHYLSTHPNVLLMPSLFIQERHSCFEPNIACLHQSGLLTDFPIRFDKEISNFLQKIWKIYAYLSTRQLDSVVSEHISRLELSDNQKNIIDFKTLVEKFKTHSKITSKPAETSSAPVSSSTWSSKIMLSQNGPVVVSKWKPRKLSDKTSSGIKI